MICPGTEVRLTCQLFVITVCTSISKATVKLKLRVYQYSLSLFLFGFGFFVVLVFFVFFFFKLLPMKVGPFFLPIIPSKTSY